MFSPRMSPIHRMRACRGGNNRDSNDGNKYWSPSPKRKTPPPPSPASAASPRLSGDYNVLKQGVTQHRQAVHDSRAALASSLDRLGEHHVRQREYDDAMDAFTEALQEKRSIMSTRQSAASSSASKSQASSMSSIFENSDTGMNSDLNEQFLDEIIITLRSMGNVHSLRGEQDEAMRYYTEVTNLRAAKNTARLDSGDDTTTLLSGLGGDEDNSTLMSEINEDVKALDDMFRSISFRNREGNSLWQSCRKSKPLAPSGENSLPTPSSKRRKSEGVGGTFTSFESEPFRRSTSLGFPATGNELTEALEMYRNTMDTYCGPNEQQHKENLNSLALRVNLMAETLKSNDKAHDNGPYAADLELAVEIYQHVLTAQYDLHNTTESETNPQTCANVASTLIRMGSLYYKLGNRLEELRMYKEAEQVYKRAFGEDHVFVAGARKNIGMVLAERGEYDDAMKQFEKARQIYLTLSPDEDTSRDVASAISCMGNVKNRVGELDEALDQYVEALDIYKSIRASISDTDNISIATRDVTSTLKVIGMVYSKKGDLDSAMSYFKEAMALLRSSGIGNSPEGLETTSSILTRMASIHVKKGDLDEAMKHYQEAYELTVRNRRTVNHPEVAGILHYIGGIFHKRINFEEATKCYQEAIRIYHATLGPGNPTVAGTLVMLGSIHYKKRNLDSAMMFYREALRLNRDAYGLHHPDVAPILKSIGTILTKKGDYKEAYDVFRDVLSIKCTIYGTGHPEVAAAYKSLGNVHYKLGELADAERQYRHALSIYRRSRGEEHPDTLAARTTIEHIRYWMKERGQHKDGRQGSSSSRSGGKADEERSC